MNFVSGYRHTVGLTQSDMARKLKISSNSYWNKEKGRVPFNDKEKVYLMNEITKIYPNLTIEEVFFAQKTKKMKEMK
ncbi:transcriptional regulator [Pediococcus argentinicus]|uniref:transcriptional regulator n=1 Tax=Pediococcus argentinicus TaxID=480391 RepID=UPI00338FC1FD